MKFDAKETGKRIHTLRSEAGLSLIQVALELNISDSYYKKLELGQRSLAPDILVAISEKYNVTTDYLLKGRVSHPVSDELDYIIDKLQTLKRQLQERGHK